jgi:type IV pilus assembly protein PilA
MGGRQHGFSLIELLIVVAIIMIVAAIAMPDFLKSRMAANQASAVGSLRVINSSEVMYHSSYGKGYSPTLKSLGPPAGGAIPSTSAAALVDSVLAAGLKSGYTFIYSANSPDAQGNYEGYTINGNPISPGTSGEVYYFTDQSYAIRLNNARQATSTDAALSK